ncbi:DUF4175 domain-containing protein [Cutibacterium sp. WCA-380-WT-3A]|uniref:DUF4175 domain-containing protein n=1 Tax=Cutibacterium porci TaxID=2605781 RepID=A0A7K0J8S3_9ACTN|nr:hypothetical protein [Cutibacterium porci]MSS46364.1 DUF4175 domain-containing protein [Cutibacterium porci]
MLSFLAAAFALGIAGFDPLGSFVLLAALGLGVRRRGVVTLLATSVGTSAIFGIAGVLGLGALLTRLGIRELHVPHLVWVWLVAILGLAFIAWAAWRLRPGAATQTFDGDTSAAPRSTAPRALAVSGLLVGLSSLIDPAFWAMLVHAAHLPHRSWAVVESLIWVACSHSLLIVLVIAYLVGGPDRVASVVTGIREDHAVAVHRGISALLAAFGAVLLADVIGVMATGQWFFEI